MKHLSGDFEVFLRNMDREICKNLSRIIIKPSQTCRNQEYIGQFTIYKHLRASFNKSLEYSVQSKDL